MSVFSERQKEANNERSPLQAIKLNTIISSFSLLSIPHCLIEKVTETVHLPAQKKGVQHMLTMRQKQAVTRTVKDRYRRCSKLAKSRMLDEFCQTSGYNRSYARRILGTKKSIGRNKRRPGKQRTYTAESTRFVPCGLPRMASVANV
ncbi:hypothetical protein KKG44_04960 [Patescibacteria group bacterium]|nr:hypothetical protein [Patescibacteria group bacterium]MBU2460433.1 hypothetical protein [Patescibacteria group bacterium]MBU2544252.1 hypothetical protein [Patescibacteria group bacterium]